MIEPRVGRRSCLREVLGEDRLHLGFSPLRGHLKHFFRCASLASSGHVPAPLPESTSPHIVQYLYRTHARKRTALQISLDGTVAKGCG